jgi:hypothetical protein
MLPSSVRIFVCTTPQDMRRSFDGLAQHQALDHQHVAAALDADEGDLQVTAGSPESAKPSSTACSRTAVTPSETCSHASAISGRF